MIQLDEIVDLGNVNQQNNSDPEQIKTETEKKFQEMNTFNKQNEQKQCNKI